MLWSVVLITRNENTTLPRLVKSLQEFQDKGGEIIVCDTGSTDSTPEVARSLGCKVYEVGNRFRVTIDEKMAPQINYFAGAEVVHPDQTVFDFASARNYAASLASNDMICMPDADEIFTSYNLEEISKAIEGGAEQLEYNFVYSHDEFGKESIKFGHCKFYNRTKLHWDGIIHEILVGEARKVWLPENTIKLEHFQNKHTDRSGYLTGLALDCYLNPDKDRQRHYFARELMYVGQPMAAILHFKKHIEMSGWLQERAQSLIYIGECYQKLRSENSPEEWWQQAINMDCSRREAFIRLALYYRSKDDFQRAACYASAALMIKTSTFYSDNQAHYAQVPHEILYWALYWLGQKEEAKKHFEIAKSYLPNNEKYKHDQQFFNT